jgi:hypothetical protein
MLPITTVYSSIIVGGHVLFVARSFLHGRLQQGPAVWPALTAPTIHFQISPSRRLLELGARPLANSLSMGRASLLEVELWPK